MASIDIISLPAAASVAATDVLVIQPAAGGDSKKATKTALLSGYADLREGNWTPQLQFGGANVGLTTSTSSGRYVREGPLVWFEGRIVMTAKGSSVGNATIIGLPFVASALYSQPVTFFWLSMGAALVQMTGIFQSSPSGITIYGLTAAGISLLALTEANFGATSQIRFGGQFYTADLIH